MPNHSPSWSSDESQFRQLTLIRWLSELWFVWWPWWAMIRLLFVIWMRYDFGPLFVSIIRNIFCADKVLMPNHSSSWSSDESQFRQLTLIRWLVVWTMIRLLFVIWMRYDFGALFVSIIRNIFCADKVLMPNHSPSWSSDES